MTKNIHALADQIANLSSPDEINIIIRAIRQAQSNRQNQARAEFRVGDVVCFQNKYHQRIIGRVEAILPKNISVRAEDTNTRWRVSPSLLRRV